uniref:Protein MEI2-like 2 n=1 Tax=Rhizophora mucronata TaxID=61149 RepID=A0A2P2PRW1_RHIMU
MGAIFAALDTQGVRTEANPDKVLPFTGLKFPGPGGLLKPCDGLCSTWLPKFTQLPGGELATGEPT